jgi:hypothetical protein
VLTPGDPNGLTKKTPTIAQYLKQAGYNSVQFGKWHVGDKLENFPTSNGFDEMRDMLPYYAGVYAYDDLALHPNFPKNDKTFMAVWNQVDLSQWDGKASEAPTAVKKESLTPTSPPATTSCGHMPSTSSRPTPRTTIPSLCIFASSRCTTRTTPRRAGRASLPAAATISTP